MQPGHIFVISFCPEEILSIPTDNCFNYLCRFWLLLSSEDSEVDNHLEKIHFADLVKDAKSVAGFCASPANFKLDRMMSHKHSLTAK